MTVTSPVAEKHAATRGFSASRFDQSMLVLVLTLALVVVGGLTTQGFLSPGNFRIVLIFSAAPGIVALGLALTILGKGIDLSIGAVVLVTGQFTLELISRGWSEAGAIGAMILVAIVLGFLNGWLISVLGVPALFVTLATGQLLLGGVKIWFLQSNLYTVDDGSFVASLGRGSVLDIPTAVLLAGVVFVLAWVLWSLLSFGRLIRAVGDNFESARTTGAPVRPLQISTYVISALMGTFAGYLILAREGSVTTTGTAFSPLLFSALIAVVVGGVSLSGGHGHVLGVLLGTLFIGIINNLLILQSLGPSTQSFILGATLMLAIIIDARLHPRDLETSKSGDL